MLRDFTWTEKYEEAMSDEHLPIPSPIDYLLKMGRMDKEQVYMNS